MRKAIGNFERKVDNVKSGKKYTCIAGIVIFLCKKSAARRREKKENAYCDTPGNVDIIEN